ncbi:MAG: carbohydrate-binding family 9-like protein [Clostridia bacterium]|nr:carbohydrate-binding family 9-like protein [Clostridia bacterium]
MYIIKKTENRKLSMFDKAWEKANVADVTCINWSDFSYAPNTTAKILYNDFGIWVQMQTDEKDILARCTTQNGHVSNDSCMEFFFRPNENDPHYLNFEFNAFGTMYMGCRTDRYNFVNPDVNNRFFNIESYVEEGNWIIQYFVPFSFIDGIFGCHTKKMYGNLYKVGVDTAVEHYVSYAPIDSPEPDFHRPESFVEFILE